MMDEGTKQASLQSCEKEATNATESIKCNDKNTDGGVGVGGIIAPPNSNNNGSKDQPAKTPFAADAAFKAVVSDKPRAKLPAPNSKPREKEPAPVETYVYQDFSHAEPSSLDTGTCHKRAPPQSLQSQKLPSKLAAMLSDPDLASVITWMPHGRSWKILNREIFSNFALPRYFGHSNHSSFVRIVNAWGFRRVSAGVDRDTYYHELFLRGKPLLHERMKRLPSCHRKTPVNKDDKAPDFYELAKTSPLPEVSWSASSGQLPNKISGGGFASVPGVGSFPTNLNPASMMNTGSFMPDALRPIHFGDATGAYSSMNGLMGSGTAGGRNAATSTSLNMADNHAMMSLLGMNRKEHADQKNLWSSSGSCAPSRDVSLAYTQNLQQENENLLLKIKLLEYENQARQQKMSQPSSDQQLQQYLSGQNNQQSSAFGGGNGATGGGALGNNGNNAFGNQM